jgi:threonine dehydratase
MPHPASLAASTAEVPALPTPDDVRAAASRLLGHAHRTPVLTSRTLDERTGAAVFVKCEAFQRGGAFKFRGAYNALSRLSAQERRRGVVAFSSGNHAQAVALAGRELGLPVVVVMPADAPASKTAATRGYGAEVVPYDRATQSREEIAGRLQAERGMTLVPPYDHADVVAGQGTAALELFEEVGPLDALLVPCGGGGLLSGTALAARAVSPACRVMGVEPELADDATRSFRTGELQVRQPGPDTIADGLRTPSLGRITFPLVRELVAGMRTVTEEQIVAGMDFLWTRMKVVAEPSGAVPLGSLLADSAGLHGARVGIIVSGGNVDLGTAFALLAR